MSLGVSLQSFLVLRDPVTSQPSLLCVSAGEQNEEILQRKIQCRGTGIHWSVSAWSSWLGLTFREIIMGFFTSAKQSLSELWWVRNARLLLLHLPVHTRADHNFLQVILMEKCLFTEWMSSTPASSTHTCTHQNSPILETDTTFYAWWCNFLFLFASNRRQNMLNVCSLKMFSDKHK